MKTAATICFSFCLLLATAILVQGPWSLAKRSVLGRKTSAAGVVPAPALIDSMRTSKAVQLRVLEGYGKLPLSFERNQGQTVPEVKFISRANGYTLYLTSVEAVLTLRRSLASGEPIAEPGIPQVFSKHKGIAGTQEVKLEEIKHRVQGAVRMQLVGANLAAGIEGLDPLPGKSNYFIGNDPAKWRTDIPTYAKVRYGGVYPGVDLVYYGNQGRLEYDFVVAPGADPRTIRLAIAGAENLEAASDGNLVLRTAGGEVRLHNLIVYQQVGGVRKEIAGRYVLRSKRQICFEVAAYDASKPLIIDPVLSYSTYLGGSAGDAGNAIAVDSSGNAYVTGTTNSTDFATKNPLQPASGGAEDAFVTKLDPTGSTLVYSAYLGGSAGDAGNAIAVDSSGNAYVTGSTNSANFPTASAFQATCGSCASGKADAFVAKLNAAGSALVYSTFLGGNGQDAGNAIAVDSAGNAYVTGSTVSLNFPTASPFQAACGACSRGQPNAFVSKLNAAGSALVYSTYLGGSGNGTDGDFGNGIAVDASNNAYVTGFIAKHDFEDGDDVPGVLIAMGPGIKRGTRVFGLPMSVFDIAPTILYIYGNPAPKQMKGRVLTEIFESTAEPAPTTASRGAQ